MPKTKLPKPPVKLEGEALEYWKRHAERLWDSGKLTSSDLDSFCVLCDLWAMHTELRMVKPGADAYREMVQLNNVSKEFFKYAREFGLLGPAARRKAKDDDAETDEPKDEFGF
ncbi:MAG: hypothetical protein ACRC8S_00555 [Fimbriiglobus sp.]